MKISVNGTENRLVFFDNLRFLFVLFVVLQHSGNAYSNLGWWPVVDENTSIAVEWFNAFSDAFAMPLLFYIAGYFACRKRFLHYQCCAWIVRRHLVQYFKAHK